MVLTSNCSIKNTFSRLLISACNILVSGVVATTHWNGTCDILTSAKLSVGYLVVGITKELDKKPLLHCSSIYINYM